MFITNMCNHISVSFIYFKLEEPGFLVSIYLPLVTLRKKLNIVVADEALCRITCL